MPEPEFVSMTVQIPKDLFDRFKKVRGVSGDSYGLVSQSDAIVQILEFALPYVELAQSPQLKFNKEPAPNKIKVK